MLVGIIGSEGETDDWERGGPVAGTVSSGGKGAEGTKGRVGLDGKRVVQA